jgi:molybdopterin/thiamine biosynthesis adenylyltransferase
VTEADTHLSDDHKAIFHRHMLIPEIGEAGQLRLLNSRVLIIGLGGLGSPALYYIAACGIGHIGIVDGDRVEPSNLHRQILHGKGDLGKDKTVSACEKITSLYPDTQLNPYPVRLSTDNAEEMIQSYDFVIDATDNFESKFLINDTCVALGKPFSHAGILGTYGQTMTVVPGKTPCFRCVFDDIPPAGSVKTTAEVGVLGTLPGLFGMIQATEAIKYLTSCGTLLTGRLLTWDALAMAFREIKLPEEKRCRVCRKV